MLYHEKLVRLFLLIAFGVSAASAADVSPMYFESVGASSDENHDTQQQYWEDLMKYKIWGTKGVVFNKGNIIIKETSGLNGSAGVFYFSNGDHRLGGPILAGGDISFSANNTSPDKDSLYRGPIRVLGDLKLASWYNAPDTRYEGDVCVKGDVVIEGASADNIKTSTDRWMENVRKDGGKVYASFDGADSTYEKCPEKVPNVDAHLTVPRWDVPDNVKWRPAISLMVGEEETAYLDVPPIMGNEDPVLDKVVDIYLEKIEMASNPHKYLYIRMPSTHKRFVRIHLRDGLDINASANSAVIQVVYVNDDAVWDESSKSWKNFDASKSKFVENKDYAGDVLFYTTKDMDWSSMIEPSYQGTFMTSGNFVIHDHFVLAGQLIADSIFFESDITGDFRYVPFDPPILDPKLFSAMFFPENNETVQVKVQLSKDTKVDVRFDYCFDFSSKAVVDGVTADQFADATDFNLDVQPMPVCGKSIKSVEILANSDTATVETQIKINVKKDNLLESYVGGKYADTVEILQLRVMNLEGAVIEDNLREGVFKLNIVDRDVTPETKDTTFVVNEDDSLYFDKVVFPYTSSVNSAMNSVVIKTVPATGTLFYFGKPYKGDPTKTIPVDSLGELVFVAKANDYGKGDDYEYASFEFAVVADNGGRSYDRDGCKGTCFNTITLNVNPVNDAPVVKPATFTISGHAIFGGDSTILDGAFVVTDVDDSVFTYAFDSTDPNFALVDSLFVIDENTGVISVKSGIELNENISKALYEIGVVVSDKSSTTGNVDDIISVKTTATIKVSYNNNAPTIVTDTISIVENSKPGVPADSPIKATDKDVSDTVKVFKLVGESDWFEVSENGVVTVKKDAKVDFEKFKTVTLKVQVCDEYAACTEKNVVVKIIDQDFNIVKIEESTEPSNCWSKPKGQCAELRDTVYTNKEDIKLYCSLSTLDGGNPYACADTTLKDGCHLVVKTADETESLYGGELSDSVVVCVSTKAPEVTISLKGDSWSSGDILTIIQPGEGFGTDVFVNSSKKELVVSVRDSVTGVFRTDSVVVNMSALDVSKATVDAMNNFVDKKFSIHNEDSTAVETPTNEGSRVEFTIEDGKGVSLKVTYNKDADGNVKETEVIDENGKADKRELITISYETLVGGEMVTVSYLADANTGLPAFRTPDGKISFNEKDAEKGGLFSVSQKQKDDAAASVSYFIDGKGNIVKNSEGDVGYTLSYTYVNKPYGNVATQSIFVVLDVKKPGVVIWTPGKGDVIKSNVTDVLWYVCQDGDDAVEARKARDAKDSSYISTLEKRCTLKDTLKTQGLEKGYNIIERFFVDKAGNEAYDTVLVYMKDAKEVNLEVEQPVTVLTKELVEKYYADNPPKEGQTFSVSIRNPKTGNEKETQIGGSFGSKDGSGKAPYPSVMEKDDEAPHLGPSLVLDIKLPVVNGVSGLATMDDIMADEDYVLLSEAKAEGAVKMDLQTYVDSFCVAGFDPGTDLTKANLYDSKLDVKIWVYTSLGNFVNYYSFTQKLNDPDFTDPTGKLQLFFEQKPDIDGFVRTDTGRLLATGAYIYKVEAKVKNTLQCTLPPLYDKKGQSKLDDPTLKRKGDVIKSDDNLLKPFGYKRPKM